MSAIEELADVVEAFEDSDELTQYPEDGAYVAQCPACGGIEGMTGVLRYDAGDGEIRCDCCGLIWGGI